MAVPSMALISHMRGADLPPLAYGHGAGHDVALTRPAGFRPVKGTGWLKPESGGLWTAPVTKQSHEGLPVDSTWLEWTRSEDWGTEHYTHLTEILPMQNACVAVIDSQNDLRAITDRFPAWLIVNGARLKTNPYPDWVGMAAAGWDAVYLTDRGQWATRLPATGPDLYGWDAASVLWLQPAYTVGRTTPAERGGSDG